MLVAIRLQLHLQVSDEGELSHGDHGMTGEIIIE
jgi:hypothetical protein